MVRVFSLSLVVIFFLCSSMSPSKARPNYYSESGQKRIELWNMKVGKKGLLFKAYVKVDPDNEMSMGGRISGYLLNQKGKKFPLKMCGKNPVSSYVVPYEGEQVSVGCSYSQDVGPGGLIVVLREGESAWLFSYCLGGLGCGTPKMINGKVINVRTDRVQAYFSGILKESIPDL